ncbi:MAG: cytochrome c biogenesis protein CcdA [Spirochaetaceae bacterium]|nr:MAG: cytochrome c biogenesis protein CcdA [Spirochaetaceae bacterium]
MRRVRSAAGGRVDTPTIGLSFLAGLLSFVSPCVLPLLPSYLSFVSGATLSQMRDDSTVRRAVVANTLMFVLGFTVIFVTLGVVFAGSALLFPGATQIINVVAGTIVIVLGLNIVFDFIKVLNLEARFHLSEKPRGLFGSFLVGLAFAAGWTPCIGPILTGILFLAGTSGNVTTGVFLLIVYSAGLAVPFVLTAIFFGTATRLFAKIKRHFVTIRIVTGSILIAIGTLIAIGRFQELNIWLLRSASAVSRWASANPGAARVIPAMVLFALAIVSLIPAARRAFGSDRAPVIRPVGAAIASLFAVLAVLQLTTVIDLMSVVSSWLAFQGL